MDRWNRFFQFEGTVAQAIRTAAWRLRVRPEDRCDFGHDLLVALIERDALAKVDQSLTAPAFIARVVNNLAIAWFRRRTGRWRPSAVARRLGRQAIRFERLVDRDGWQRTDALQSLGPDHVDPRVEGRLSPRVRTNGIWQSEFRRTVLPAPDGTIEQLEAAGDAARVRNALRSACRRLGLADQAILSLRFLHGMTMREISTRLGFSAEQVSKRFQRAKRRLRAELRSRGVGPTEADACIGVDCVEAVLDELNAIARLSGAREPTPTRAQAEAKQSKAKQSKASGPTADRTAWRWCPTTAALAVQER
jgi:RNA polymerase sigma factor (sigma-70 family)